VAARHDRAVIRDTTNTGYSMRSRLTFTPLFTCAVLALSVAGCDDDKVVGPSADCSSFSATGESPSCSDLCAVSNESFCGDNGTQPDCSTVRPGSLVDVCGVPLPAPEVAGEIIELERSKNVEEFSGTGAPDLSCFEAGSFPDAPGTPENVTFQGIVKIFSHGCETSEVAIEAFTVLRDGSANDGMPDQSVASTMTAEDCTLEGVEEENEDCTEFDGVRWECRYTLENMPTETELMIVTSGTGWATLYEYNVYASNGEAQDGMFEKDIRAIVTDDYNVIPQTAIGKSIENGNGAVGGEVHDCGDVRLTNAIVDVDIDRELTYFTDNELTPLPDAGAKATSTLGLYAALDVREGPITVAAGGVVDGALVGTGIFRARVFPNSITSVTFRGLRPFQVPK
jgi:hypothetical protein